MRIDLHTHSRVSDGTESPAELIQAASRAGLDAVALTDHDTTLGWAEAAHQAKTEGLEFIPGMEISCRTANGITVHLLSYFHDPEFPELLAEINHSRQSRVQRAERMVELLAEDYPITWADVQAQLQEDATVGRPHIADALVARGVVASRDQAFAEVFARKYWVDHYAVDPVHAVQLVQAAGGVSIFAHPVASERGRVVPESTIRELIAAGLDGVEIEHRDNPEPGRQLLRRLAEEFDLITTGSSDYHGAGKPNRLGENLTSLRNLRRIQDVAQSRS